MLLPHNLLLKPDTIQVWDALHGCSLSLVLSELSKKSDQSILIITPDTLTAYRLEMEIQFFLNDSDKTIPLLIFPDWETLPYDHFSPHQDIISERVKTLYHLPGLKNGIIIAPIATLMHRISPKAYIEACGFSLKLGETFDPKFMRYILQERGYRNVAQVYEHGEFCIRGSLFDLFPMGSEYPFRIDLFDNEVESIRTFDVETQRTIDKVTEINLLPAREFPLDEKAISLFRQQWRDEFSGSPSLCPIYQDISAGICSGGIEYYLPLFFKETACLLDFLKETTILVQLEQCYDAAEHFWQEVKERYTQRHVDKTRPLLAPDKLFFNKEMIFLRAKAFAQIKIQQENPKAVHFQTALPPELPVNHKLDNPLKTLHDRMGTPHSRRILITAETAGRREALLALFSKHDLQPKIYRSWHQFMQDDFPLGMSVALLERGLSLLDPLVDVIAESQLFGHQVMQTRRRKTRAQSAENMIRNLAELSIGSPVVHIDYGVGRYLGLQTLDDENPAEFLTLEYDGGDKLYVPITSLQLISRYGGMDLENAPLHRLGSKKWDTAKQKAAKQLRDVAAELLEIYAKREARKGHQYQIEEDPIAAFKAAFPFEETQDQEKAIEAVMSDMQSEKPMDRLICGDVGFGKTEVAMRATFIAVLNNKQTAILVPTTLLAQQHFETFKDRFADWPIAIEMISRFRTRKEQETILQNLEAGKIDIIIGTHKLLQSDLCFNRLGLLIIDEEHRFGVQQKEKIKKLRADVDLLALTATPIPRTLNMAMSGVRDLSIIATPPAKRLSIKTFIHEREDSLIREAILREIMRGGQVYFLHNKVETINQISASLHQLIPEARIRVGHGQMHERELETVMSDFYHQRFNVLLCTTIIETGIDVPTANTIIIDRADMFGLAQLHQLRGRVGRSHHQAYAYLLTPPAKILTADAKKRLEAIASLEDLGAGFTLATHDLEIRGAGEFLGEEQSGHIQALGLSLYTELLEKAVLALKSGQNFDVNSSLQQNCEIDLKISALIPEPYMQDVHLRLVFYKRIAAALSSEELDELQVEMIDRFGLLPEPLKDLFAMTKLKLQALQLGIRRIDAGPFGGKMEFKDKANVDPLAILNLIQQQPLRYQLAGPSALTFKLKETSATQRISEIEKLLDLLKNK